MAPQSMKNIGLCWTWLFMASGSAYFLDILDLVNTQNVNLLIFNKSTEGRSSNYN